MNNGFNSNQNEIIMSESEQKKHKELFSKLCVSFLIYIVITQLLSVVASQVINEFYPEALKNGNLAIILSSGIQYLVSFPILVLLIKKLPATPPAKFSISGKAFFKYLTISIFVMYLGSYISSFILTAIESRFGALPENSIETVLSESDIIISVIIVGIIGPIVEEIMFRKLFIDRLTPYGEAVAVLLPSLIFGLIHGNIYQFFYAFLIGITFSYIYVKTGKIIYTIILHCIANLFCGVLPSYVLSLIDLEELIEIAYEGTFTEEYITANSEALSILGIYSFAMMALLFIGIFNFNRNLHKIKFNKGEIALPKNKGAEIIFFNAGAILLITACIIIIALNTFSFA